MRTLRLFIPILFILLASYQTYAVNRIDSVSTQIKVSCFERINENPLLQNRNIESDVQCESACLVPCSFEEREIAFLKKIDNFPHINIKTVHAFSHYFSNEKPENTEVLFAIANEYFPIIEKVLKELSLPKELKYLPATVSALNPYYSGENGGKGIWQLTYAHASKYGITIDNMTDERLDIKKSSLAAGLYLRDLQAQFKNWPLSILAFGSSPALVNKAIQRAGSSDFEKVVAEMPSAYQNTYYTFRALVYMGENLDKNRMSVVSPSLIPASESVIAIQNIHLGQVSEVLQIPVDILKELNTSLRKDIVQEGAAINLPLGYAQNFRSKQGDIAAYRMAYFMDKPKVQPEVNLTPSGGQPSVASNNGTSGAAKTVTIKKYHSVRSGETLSKIAQKYKVSVSQLKAWNGMSGTKINVGKKLVVKVTKKEIQTPTQEDISVRQNVKIEDNDQSEVEFGEGSTQPDTDNIPTPAVVVNPPKPKPSAITTTASYTYYTVKSGDTLFSIGKKHNVPYTKIKEWNNLKSDNISIGQKLKIKK